MSTASNRWKPIARSVLIALVICAAPRAAFAQTLKIGVLTDMSGPIADMVGRGSVTAAELAVEDFGGSVLGRKIEVVSGAHQNKSDIAAGIARRWFDNEGVEAIADLAVSVTAGIVQDIANQKGKIALISGSGSLDLFGKTCSPTSFIWTFDTDVLPRTTVDGVTRRIGKKSWFVIAPDYSFGKQMVAAASDAVARDGGKVVGSVYTPIGKSDFAGPLLTAQSSGADIVAFSLGGHDFLTAAKQANEFGVQKKQTIATLFTMITDINAIGLDLVQGALLATPFYWDMDADTRNFSKRFFARMNAYPNMIQAGDYSAVMHYLKAVKAAGTTEGKAVAAKMHETPINDLTLKNARVRPDGRVFRDMYLMQVKAPAESKYPWDYYKQLDHFAAKEVMTETPSPDCRSR